MAKFKIGDRVKVLGGSSVNKIGEIGTITEIEINSYRVYGDETKSGIGNWTPFHQLELITETSHYEVY